MDLLALDLVEGRASFVKSGAAPTYIKRGKHIFCIRSDTVPVGILPEMDAKQIEFDVRDGDMVVMVSDGVASGEGECPWLSELPSDGETQSPAAVAEGILSAAAQSNPADDLSAIVLCIKHAS